MPDRVKREVVLHACEEAPDVITGTPYVNNALICWLLGMIIVPTDIRCCDEYTDIRWCGRVAMMEDVKQNITAVFDLKHMVCLLKITNTAHAV